MTRAETSSILALAYSNIRGDGDVHPTIAEIRVGHVSMCYQRPSSKKWIDVGEVLLTECEVMASYEIDPSSEKPFFTLGEGSAFRYCLHMLLSKH